MPVAAGSPASTFPTTGTATPFALAEAGHHSESVASPNWDGTATDNELETALRRRGAVSSRQEPELPAEPWVV